MGQGVDHRHNLLRPESFQQSRDLGIGHGLGRASQLASEIEDESIGLGQIRGNAR